MELLGPFKKGEVEQAEAVRAQITCGFVGHGTEFGFDPDIEGLRQGATHSQPHLTAM